MAGRFDLSDWTLSNSSRWLRGRETPAHKGPHIRHKPIHIPSGQVVHRLRRHFKQPLRTRRFALSEARENVPSDIQDFHCWIALAAGLPGSTTRLVIEMNLFMRTWIIALSLCSA